MTAYASASAADRARSPSAVRATSLHSTIASPSSPGAKARTSGPTSDRPWRFRSRSRTTDGRNRPTVWASVGTRAPGASSEVAAAPPTVGRRSRTTVRNPALPR